MKRDMELIRFLLLALEGDKEADAFSKNNYAEKTAVYHCALLIDGGFVDGSVVTDEEGEPAHAVMIRMTWKGHDFLDAMRDESIWKKARATVLKPAMTVSFEVFLAWLKSEGMKQLGLPAS